MGGRWLMHVGAYRRPATRPSGGQFAVITPDSIGRYPSSLSAAPGRRSARHATNFDLRKPTSRRRRRIDLMSSWPMTMRRLVQQQQQQQQQSINSVGEWAGGRTSSPDFSLETRRSMRCHEITNLL